MKKLSWAIAILAIFLIGWFLITPIGQRTKPITDTYTDLTKKTPLPIVTPVAAPSLERIIPPDKTNIGGMQVGDVVYTYPAAVILVGEHVMYLDPNSGIKNTQTSEYCVKVVRKMDGHYVTAKAYRSSWRRFSRSSLVSMELIPITHMD